MTTSDNPWTGLIAGGVDARRVDPHGRHDFFWIVSARSEPGLLLRLSPDTKEIRPLPRMRNLDLAYVDTGVTRALVLLLRDTEQQELFVTLCHDIVRAAGEASDGHGALQRMLRRTLRWHHLLRGGTPSRLSIEEQRGLIGELLFLKCLSDLIGPCNAIESWKGPMGTAKDFELDRCVVEIKAKRGASRAAVQISSEEQLTDVEGRRLYLVISTVDMVLSPPGMTLADHVVELDRLFLQAGTETYALWEQTIAATGYDPADDYSDRRWLAGQSIHYEVRDGFPRITGPLPLGLSGVRYSLQLDACADFKLDSAHFENLVRGDLVNGRVD